MLRIWALVAVLLLGLTGCGGGSDAPAKPTLTVFAAASLTEAFTDLGKRFEREHDVRVEFNFGPSSGLATQIEAGAEPDVFAAASPTPMKQLRDADLVDAPRVFAANALEIAVPPDNPAKISGLRDLRGTLALCQADVPCGAAAAQLFKGAGIDPPAASEEVDVKAVLTKVILGEVDAGIVYVTDVRAAGPKVRGVPIPAAQNVSTDYPIAAVSGGPQQRLAKDFVDLVDSEAGHQVLRDRGFDVD